jgi:hypothetical protein
MEIRKRAWEQMNSASRTVAQPRTVAQARPEKRKKRTEYIPGFSKPFTDAEIDSAW